MNESYNNESYNNESYNNQNYDVVIIGAGIVGCLTARQLSKYNLKICLLEKQSDAAMGASAANSGIIHAGYDAEPGSLKAKLNIQGNEMMDEVATQLCVPFKRVGSLVLAFNHYEIKKIEALYEKGIENGVQSMKILTASEVREKEPNVSQETIGALYAENAGIICPYELTIGALENAVENGVDLFLECEVKDIQSSFLSDKNDEKYKPDEQYRLDKQYRSDKQYNSDTYWRPLYSISTSKGEFRAKYVINCAGIYADNVAAMVGDKSFSLTPRKGEYVLFDKRQGGIVNSVIFRPPNKMGKGVLVVQTVDGNLLTGPNAEDIEDRNDVSTTAKGQEYVLKEALKSVPVINKKSIITSFAGIRAISSTGDFIIGESNATKCFINVAGIESPGLTASPAIALYVEDILKRLGLKLIPKSNYKALRQPIKTFRDKEENELRDLIGENPLYGRIVCRCEKVSAAEIIDSIRRPAGARTLDGIKRRTRAGMGRCQGGFCTPRVMEILSNELGIPLEEITKLGKGSCILAGKTK